MRANPRFPHLVRRPGSARLVALLLCLFPSLLPAWPWDIKWREVTPEEQAMTTPKIDPEAGVECLASELILQENVTDAMRILVNESHYVRLKVFNDRGVEALQLIRITSNWDEEIKRVGARVLRPDGRIEVLPDDAFHEREVARMGTHQAQATSFSIPGLEPGTIVEYQFQRVRRSLRGLLVVNQPYPVHTALVTMISDLPLSVVYSPIPTPPERKKDKLYFTFHDLPAISREPFLPPFGETVTWIQRIIGPVQNKTAEENWQEQARQLKKATKSGFKGEARTIRAKAEELTADITDPAEKVQRLYDFCLREIEHLESDWNPRSSAEMEDLSPNHDAVQTLEHGYGSEMDIDLLFGSLCQAAGLEVVVAAINDHSRMLFDRATPNPAVLEDGFVAVKIGEGWTLHSPGRLYLPFRQLPWRNEFAPALLGDDKEAHFFLTPVSTDRDNLVQRKGRFTLAADGSLTGTVTLTYLGQWSTAVKRRLDGLNQATLEERVKHDFLDALPQAEVSGIAFTNLRDPAEPVTLTATLAVPNYADATSKRLFLQIDPFEFTGALVDERNTDRSSYMIEEFDDLLVRTPRLVPEKRVHAVYFPFNFAVEDDIRIALPEGYVLEEASAPGGNIENKIVDHVISVGFAPKSRQVVLKRRFKLARCTLPVENYAVVRDLFDRIQERDRHVLTLRAEE